MYLLTLNFQVRTYAIQILALILITSIPHIADACDQRVTRSDAHDWATQWCTNMEGKYSNETIVQQEYQNDPPVYGVSLQAVCTVGGEELLSWTDLGFFTWPDTAESCGYSPDVISDRVELYGTDIQIAQRVFSPKLDHSSDLIDFVAKKPWAVEVVISGKVPQSAFGLKARATLIINEVAQPNPIDFDLAKVWSAGAGASSFSLKI